MRSLPKLLWRIILVLGVLLLVGVAALWLLAPVVVHSALKRELRDRGFPDAQLEVRHVGLRRAAIEGVRLHPEGRLTARQVIATYGPFDLMKGEIDTLRIVEASWIVRIQDRTLDLGPVDELLAQRDDDDGTGADLPVQRIELLASELVLVTPTGRWPVPIEGVIERTADGLRAQLSAGPRALPIALHADVQRRPRLQADVSLQVHGRGSGPLQLEGQLAGDGRVHMQVRGQDWSTAAMVSGRPVAIEDLSIAGHATLARDPLTLEALQLQLHAGDVRVGERQLQALAVTAAQAESGIELAAAWTAPSSRVALAVGGLPTRPTAESLHDARFWWRTEITASPDTDPLTVAASGDARALRDDGEWSVRIGEGQLQVLSRPRALKVEIAFAAMVDQDTISLAAEPSGSTSTGMITAGDLRATLRRLQVQVHPRRVAGQWEGRGHLEIRLAPVVHAASNLRVEQVAVTLPLSYPFAQASAVEPGRLRVGPVHVRGATLPAVTGTLAQRGDALTVALKWPLTPGVAARGRGRLELTDPPAVTLNVTVPPLALAEAEGLATLVGDALGGSVRGTAELDGQLEVRDGNVSQALRVQLNDVTVSRGDKLQQELHGVTGTLVLDSVLPPRSPGGQRLTWDGGRIGKLALGTGHVDLSLEPDQTLLVEELATELGERGEAGRLFVGAFRYAPDQPQVRLDIFAESLSLQRWLDLLGRDEVTGSGTLHGHLSATVELRPSLRLHLRQGVLLAEPGGMLALKDVRAAKAILASAGTIRDPTSIQRLAQERLLEALKSMRYSSLRFELIREQGVVTLQAHVAGRGTRGARQEIGGLTVNIHHFEDALNELLRLRSGVKKLEPELSPGGQP